MSRERAGRPFSLVAAGRRQEQHDSGRFGVSGMRGWAGLTVGMLAVLQLAIGYSDRHIFRGERASVAEGGMATASRESKPARALRADAERPPAEERLVVKRSGIGAHGTDRGEWGGSTHTFHYGYAERGSS